MSNTIRCPECGSTDVDCLEGPHRHICYACGHSNLPQFDTRGDTYGRRQHHEG